MDETEYWYFFTHRNRKNPHGKRPDRVAADGFWKSTGANKPVLDLKKRVVGAKNALVYMNGNHEKNYSKTKWVMHEFTTHLFPRPQTDANDMVVYIDISLSLSLAKFISMIKFILFCSLMSGFCVGLVTRGRDQLKMMSKKRR